MMNYVISVCVALVAIGNAQVTKFGGCPVVPTQDHLDISKYLGLWYEIERFPAIFEGDFCTTANYTLKANGKINVDNRYIEDGVVHNVVGEASVRDVTVDESTLDVIFNNGPAGDYRVIDTDYVNYSLIFSCKSVASVINIEFAWILTRVPQPDPALITRLKNELAGYKVDVSKFQATNHTGCPKLEKFTGIHLG